MRIAQPNPNQRVTPFVDAPSFRSVTLALAFAASVAVVTVAGIEFMGL
jgi:hypothetical protein